MYVGAALSVVGVVLSFFTRDTLKKQFSDSGLSGSQIDTAVTATLAAAAVAGLIFVALYLWLARKVLAGRSWARITTLVVSGLTILVTLGSLGQPQGGLYRTVSLISALVSAAVFVLLVLKPSAEFFRRRP